MPPLDHATLQAVLDKQGMPNTTENLNRIAQFAAVAPDMLDKYLGKGTDAARVGGGTDAAIDRSIASTADPRLAQLAGPNPYTATLDPNTGLTNIGPGLVKGQAESQVPAGRVTVGQPQLASIPGDENRPVGAPPFPTTPRQQTESETDRISKGQPTPPTHAADTRPEGGGSWTNYIAPSILALFAAQMARRGGGAHVPPGATPPLSGVAPTPGMAPLPPVPTRGPTSPVPQPGATVPAPAPAPNVPPPAPAPAASARPPMAPGPGQTPADVARLQAEVDAENKALALQQQMKTRARSAGGGGRTTSP